MVLFAPPASGDRLIYPGSSPHMSLSAFCPCSINCSSFPSCPSRALLLCLAVGAGFRGELSNSPLSPRTIYLLAVGSEGTKQQSAISPYNLIVGSGFKDSSYSQAISFEDKFVTVVDRCYLTIIMRATFECFYISS